MSFNTTFSRISTLLLSGLLLSACGGSGTNSASGEDIPNEPIPNEAPTAVISGDEVIESSRVGKLSAAQSFDPDGSIVSYEWQQTAGEPVEFWQDNETDIGYTAPEDYKDFLYFELTVTDDDGATHTATVDVDVQKKSGLLELFPFSRGQYYAETLIFRGKVSSDLLEEMSYIEVETFAYTDEGGERYAAPLEDDGTWSTEVGMYTDTDSEVYYQVRDMDERDWNTVFNLHGDLAIIPTLYPVSLVADAENDRSFILSSQAGNNTIASWTGFDLLTPLVPSEPLPESVADIALDAGNNQILILAQNNDDSLVEAVDIETGELLVVVAQGEEPVAASAFAFSHENRKVYLLDDSSGAVFAGDLATGELTVISDDTTGTGPAFSFDEASSNLIALQSDTRLIVSNGGSCELVAVDIPTGDRSLVSSASTSPETGSGPESCIAHMALNGDRTQLLGISPDNAAYTIDLESGERTRSETLITEDVGPVSNVVWSELKDSFLLLLFTDPNGGTQHEVSQIVGFDGTELLEVELDLDIGESRTAFNSFIDYDQKARTLYGIAQDFPEKSQSSLLTFSTRSFETNIIGDTFSSTQRPAGLAYSNSSNTLYFSVENMESANALFGLNVDSGVTNELADISEVAEDVTTVDISLNPSEDKLYVGQQEIPPYGVASVLEVAVSDGSKRVVTEFLDDEFYITELGAMAVTDAFIYITALEDASESEYFIRQIDIASGESTLISTVPRYDEAGALTALSDILVDESGDNLFVLKSNLVLKINIETGDSEVVFDTLNTRNEPIHGTYKLAWSDRKDVLLLTGGALNSVYAIDLQTNQSMMLKR